MSFKYNDYVTITRGYLRNYKKFKMSIEDMQERKQLLTLQLNNHAPIGGYGDLVHGYNELNPIESKVDRNIRITKQIQEIERNISSLTVVINKMERIFNILSVDEYALIKGYFIDRKPWRVVADELFLSEQWARQKGNQLLKEVAGMLFGEIAIPPEQMNLFVFIQKQ